LTNLDVNIVVNHEIVFLKMIYQKIDPNLFFLTGNLTTDCFFDF